jgi:hypothetical protein
MCLGTTTRRSPARLPSAVIDEPSDGSKRCSLLASSHGRALEPGRTSRLPRATRCSRANPETLMPLSRSISSPSARSATTQCRARACAGRTEPRASAATRAENGRPAPHHHGDRTRRSWGGADSAQDPRQRLRDRATIECSMSYFCAASVGGIYAEVVEIGGDSRRRRRCKSVRRHERAAPRRAHAAAGGGTSRRRERRAR